MKKSILMLLLGLFPSVIFAQNLVSNGDFSLKSGSGCDLKDFDTPPQDWDKMEDQFHPNGDFYTQTPDYFHTCAGSSSTEYPGSNWHGCADPLIGDGYAGFLAHPPAENAYNDVFFEYIHQELANPLNLGTEYYIEFYVRPASDDNNRSAVKDLGMHLTSSLTSLENDAGYGLHHLVAQIQNSSGFYNNTSEWTKISGLFTPSSANIDHIIIGNFDIDANSGDGDYEVLPNAEEGTSIRSYYFVDAIYIAPSSQGIPEYETVNETDLVCFKGSTTVTLSNYSSLLDVTWAATPTSYFETSSGTGDIASLKAKTKSVKGQATITFTLTGECDVRTIQETFWLGSPAGVTTNPSGVPAIDAGLGSWVVIWVTSTPGATASSLNWWTNNSSALDLNVAYGNCSVECLQTGYNFVYVTSSNTCGTSPYRQIPIDVTTGGGGGMKLMAGPNPVGNDLAIEYAEIENSEVLDYDEFETPVNYVITDSDGTVVFTKSTKKTWHTLDLSSIYKQGVYILSAYQGDKLVVDQVRLLIYR